MSRVVAIGLDSVDHGLVDRLVGEGQLPNLAALRARAARARLRIPTEYRSEAPWTDFGSGRASGSNRYWSTLIFEPETYRCPTVGAATVPPFYALGPERKVIALDVPHVRPHAGVEGLQVVGWGAHDPQFPRCSIPSGLLREIEMTAGQHRAGAVEYSGSWNQPDYLERLTRVVIDGARRRGAVVRLLVERCPDWDLLLVGISDGHQPGHQMWHGVDDRSPLSDASTAPIARECLVAIHRAIDASIGDILEAAGEATVVVFSLKGMEPADAEVVAPLLIPELLHRLHFGLPLVPTPAGFGAIPPPLVPHTDRGPAWPVWQALSAARLLRLSFLGRSVARADRFLRDRLRALRRSRAAPAHGAAEPLHEPVDALSLEPVIGSVDWWHPACWYQEHWPKMRAFVIPSYSDVHLRINLAGREREGLVPAGDYEAACDEVERELRAVPGRSHGPAGLREDHSHAFRGTARGPRPRGRHRRAVRRADRRSRPPDDRPARAVPVPAYRDSLLRRLRVGCRGGYPSGGRRRIPGTRSPADAARAPRCKISASTRRGGHPRPSAWARPNRRVAAPPWFDSGRSHQSLRGAREHCDSRILSE